jgi:hypothetical protein
METGTSCAYNVSKERRISLRITVADCAGEPFKLMKVILDGLAQNPEAAFWLPNLQHSPQIVRIFPIDFAYLDSNLTVIEAAELPPGVPLPKFHPGATSALIVPMNSLAANRTEVGDKLIICSEEELQQLLADPGAEAATSLPALVEPEPETLAITFEDPLPEAPVAPVQFPERISIFSAVTTTPIQPAAVASTGAFTVAVANTWQAASPLLLEPVETSISNAPTSKPDLVEIASEPRTSDPSPVPESAALDKFESAPVREQQPPQIEIADITVLERALTIAESHGPAPARVADTPKVLEPDEPVQRSTEELIARSKEAAEKAYVKVAAPAKNATARPKKKSERAREPKKDHLGNRVIRWLALDDPLPERRKIIRLVLQGLQVYDANSESARRYDVRDICPPGIFIRTDQPWQPGDSLSLVLVKEGATERDHEQRVSIQARVVRRDDEGIAIAFVFPEGTEFQPWQRAKTKRSDETEADFILRELRLARALGFLRRLCPWCAEEVNHALLDRFSNKRVASAVEVVLKAEDILHRRGHVAQPFIASDLLIRILESGSWIEEDWIRRMWAGLLVSSCSADGQDRSNLPFIDLLARLTPIHLRILSFVCHRGVEALAAGESEAALDLYSSAEELMEAADSHSFPRIQQTIGQLSSVGLLAETARPSYVAMSDKAKTRTTPTPLGLKMYARCNGHQS